MILKIPEYNRVDRKKKYLVLDFDTYLILEKRINDLRLGNGSIKVKSKTGKEIPIWRIARRNFNKEFTIKYKDGDKYNLQRENLILKRV